MPTTVFINIKQLVNVRSRTRLLHGKEMAELPCTDNAYLIVEDGLITETGSMDAFRYQVSDFNDHINAAGCLVLPCWCDSHTHLVFPASREDEFVDKIRGAGYAEIAAKGGGILNSARKLAAMSEDALFIAAWKRLGEIAATGTGAVEIKSGYGLSVETELKMLRVIKRLKEKSSLSIKATFLGAHAYPLGYKDNHPAYIRLLVEEMLPVIAREKLADYIDVFCETGFFSPEETEQVCRAGRQAGLQPRLHVNQLNSIGGIETGIKTGAVSLDHLETLTAAEIELLSGAKALPTGETWQGVCTLLPTAAFFLRMPFQPARALLEAGCAVALASDYNPGSSPSGNMNFVVSLACIQMKMLPAEAINAATINGAYALELGDLLGSITAGKKANLILTKPVPSLAYLPYSFGSCLVDKVMISGSWL
jgi:imidazolonepropionase